jgi:hypothetical protein
VKTFEDPTGVAHVADRIEERRENVVTLDRIDSTGLLPIPDLLAYRIDLAAVAPGKELSVHPGVDLTIVAWAKVHCHVAIDRIEPVQMLKDRRRATGRDRCEVRASIASNVSAVEVAGIRLPVVADNAKPERLGQARDDATAREQIDESSGSNASSVDGIQNERKKLAFVSEVRNKLMKEIIFSLRGRMSATLPDRRKVRNQPFRSGCTSKTSSFSFDRKYFTDLPIRVAAMVTLLLIVGLFSGGSS